MNDFLLKKNIILTFLSLLFVAVTFFSACTKAPDYPKEPIITYHSISEDTIVQWTGSTIVEIGFTDGDGDLGSTAQQTGTDAYNAFFIDTRQPNAEPRPFVMEAIPRQGTGNGVSGEIRFNLDQICCIDPDGFIQPGKICPSNPNFPIDKTTFRIYIKDRSGNKSNVVETSPIYLRCN